jgi:hypothetical protein
LDLCTELELSTPSLLHGKCLTNLLNSCQIDAMTMLALFNPLIYKFGDFNLDVLQNSKSQQGKEYIDLLFSFGLLQIISKPSRAPLNSAMVIDLFLTMLITVLLRVLIILTS